MSAPKVLVLRAPGINCERETHFAFARAGGAPEFVHITELLQQPDRLFDYRILAVPGGFSYGDDIASGRVLAQEMKGRLGDRITQFRDRGGLAIGICNGFQVLVQTGLLLADPATGAPLAALAHNTSGRFVSRWVSLRAEPADCVFLQGLDTFELPVAHGEGRFVVRSAADFAALDAAGRLVLRYAADARGGTTNPNGAMGDVAGACDTTGRVLGLMPHPERFIEATQHPSWSGRLDPDAPGAGLAIFVNAIRAVS